MASPIAADDGPLATSTSRAPVAVVSGSNRGLGLELCRQLLQHGWHVVALCRRAGPELEALSSPAPGASASSAAAGAAATLTVLESVDVASDSCVALLQQRLEGVPVGLVIANAGVLGVDSLADFDAAAIRSQFEVNALGPLRLVAALRSNLQPGTAKVALITSKMGSIGVTRDSGKAGSAGYRMSKAAANMGGQLLALELADLAVPVVMLHPGAVVTDMYRSYHAAVGAGGGTHAHAPSAHGPVSVQEAAAAVLARLDELTLAGTGRFLQAATGAELPW